MTQCNEESSFWNLRALEMVDLNFSRVVKLFITDQVAGHSHASIIIGKLEAKRLWSNANRILVENNFQSISESEIEVAQSYPTLCDPMNCSLPGSSVHGIFQARSLEWAAISFSRGSSPPRDGNLVSRIEGRCFTVWATREVHLYTSPNFYSSKQRIKIFESRHEFKTWKLPICAFLESWWENVPSLLRCKPGPRKTGIHKTGNST